MRAFRLVLCALVFYHVVRGIWLLCIVPPWQGPDEPMHFLLAVAPASNSMTEAERVYVERTVILSMAEFDFWGLTGQVEPNPLPHLLRTSRGSPPATLYHRLLGTWLRVTGAWGDRAHDETLVAKAAYALRIGRLFSVLLGAGALVFLFLLSSRLFDHSWVTVLPPLLLLAHPQASFIGSCMNSDNLLVFLSALGLYFLSTLLRRPASMGALLLIVGLCVGAPLAKRSGLVVTATLLPAALWYRFSRKRILLSIMLLGVMVASLASLWFLGLGKGMMADLAEVLGVGGWVGERVSGWWGIFLTHFWTTFWGNYGWVQCPFDPFWYKLLALFLAATLVLVPLGYKREPRSGAVFLAVMASQIVFALMQVVAALGFRGELGQGRHVFVALPSLVILCTLGLRGMMRQDTPWWSWPLLGLVFVGLNEAATCFVLVPCFLR